MYRFITVLTISVSCSILLGCAVEKMSHSKQKRSENDTQIADGTSTHQATRCLTKSTGWHQGIRSVWQ
jgi:hypothetical protein